VRIVINNDILRSIGVKDELEYIRTFQTTNENTDANIKGNQVFFVSIIDSRTERRGRTPGFHNNMSSSLSL